MTVTLSANAQRLRAVASFIRQDQPRYGFLAKMRTLIEYGRMLTPAQIAAAADIIEERLDDEYAVLLRQRFAPVLPEFEAPAALVAAPAADVPFGTYTIAFDSGRHVTLRVLKSHNPRYPAPKLDLLTGPDNEISFTSLGRIVDGTLRAWRTDEAQGLLDRPNVRRAVDALLGSDSDRRSVYGQAYSRQTEVWEEDPAHPGDPAYRILASVRCFKCGRTLTVPTSIENGQGPECILKD